VHRSLVSFAALLRDEEPPPGRRLAGLLAARVPGAHGIGLRGDYTWVVRHREGELHVSWLDDRPPLQWLVSLEPDDRDPSALAHALHKALDDEPRITDVRWYTAADWNDGAVLWAPAPG
jgi:hypothetical protein